MNEDADHEEMIYCQVCGRSNYAIDKLRVIFKQPIVMYDHYDFGPICSECLQRVKDAMFDHVIERKRTPIIREIIGVALRSATTNVDQQKMIDTEAILNIQKAFNQELVKLQADANGGKFHTDNAFMDELQYIAQKLSTVYGYNVQVIIRKCDVDNTGSEVVIRLLIFNDSHLITSAVVTLGTRRVSTTELEQRSNQKPDISDILDSDENKKDDDDIDESMIG